MLTLTTIFLLITFQVCIGDSNQETGDLDEVCYLPPKTGLCRALFRTYYYNATSNTCKLFAYGGCGGNGNRFWNGEDCVATCGGTIDESEDLYSFRGDFDDYDFDGPCTEPHEYGSCDMTVVRFYFDGLRCLPFLWSGCGGNSNNFETMEECDETCKEHDRFSR